MRILITSLVLMFSVVSYACDNCNIYLNFSPNDYQNSIGIFFRQRIMFGAYNEFGEMITTKHAGHGNDKALWGNSVLETYQTFELRGNYYFREKWKTSLFIPLVNNSQDIEGNRRYQITGIGDPLVLQSYQVFSTRRDTVERLFSHRLMLGGGLKLPLGKTNMATENGTPNLDLQPGSGSWDLIFYAAYSARYRFLGISTNVNFRKNGRDQHTYRYGNTFNGTLNLFGDAKFKKFTFRLYSGLYFEKSKMDDSRNDPLSEPFIHTDTGGEILFLNGGVQFFARNFVLFGELQTPVKTELNGYSQLLTRNKINVGITYNF